MVEFGQRASYSDADNCYRHPDRGSFILCHRCGKTVCEECQIPQPVGLICPACQREAAPSRRVSFARAARAQARSVRALETPVTYGIIALCTVVWIAQLLLPQTTAALWYSPAYLLAESPEPWRMLTAMFAHSPSFIFHFIFNMYALYLFGRQLEQMLGTLRYAALYLLSGFAGSVVVTWWGVTGLAALMTPTVGASGALFGVMAATFVVYRRLQLNVSSLAVLLAINLLIGFIPGSSVSWQAHLGGMLCGAAVAALLWRSRRSRKLTGILIGGAGLLLVALSWLFVLVFR